MRLNKKKLFVLFGERSSAFHSKVFLFARFLVFFPSNSPPWVFTIRKKNSFFKISQDENFRESITYLHCENETYKLKGLIQAVD